MADMISISSDILTLTTFAVFSTRSLLKAIESFQTHQRKVRELKDELSVLLDVL